MVSKNILILTSGKVSRLDAFKGRGVTLGSFQKINFDSLDSYDLIYFRFVGKSLEIATLIVDYAIKNRIQIVDSVYKKSLLMPSSHSKLVELKKLKEAGILIPKTYFGKFPKYPYILKSTTGQKAREVWLVTKKKDLPILDKKKNYFTQELIPNAWRIRVLVIGDRAIGAIKRQTKWNKDETKETVNPIPPEIAKLAVDSAKAVNLEICGVDILVNSKTNKFYVIEANAAPSWELINKYCGVSVEDEIIKYLQSKV